MAERQQVLVILAEMSPSRKTIGQQAVGPGLAKEEGRQVVQTGFRAQKERYPVSHRIRDPGWRPSASALPLGEK